MRPEDASAIGAVAARAFVEHGGHYHADPHLAREAAGEVYRDWAIRSCTEKSVADGVFAAWSDGAVVGFVTVRRNSESETEAVLGGVAREAQGRGVPNALIVQTLRWSLEIGARWSAMSTQIANIAMQKVLFRNRYELRSSGFILHKWYDR